MENDQNKQNQEEPNGSHSGEADNTSRVTETTETADTVRETIADTDSKQANRKEAINSEILKKRFEAEFTKIFAGFSAISKGKKDSQMTGPDDDPHAQQTVLAHVLASFTNMHMAHELCIDPEYTIKLPEINNSMESRIGTMMRKAYWDLVNEDLEQDPPVYEHALKVFEEIRDKLLTLLLPHNVSLRVRILDTLDVEQIRKEVEHGALDFERYVNFMVDCLAKLCSPVRDQQVEVIRQFQKPSDIFRRLFEVMDDMLLDLMNFYLTCHRHTVMEHCVGYERHKFVEFLEMEYERTHDGMRNTRAWLLRHKVEGTDTKTIIAKAFGEIISWNPENPWPETLAMDQQRLARISQMVKRATIFCAMSLSVIELCKPLFLRNYSIYNTIRSDLDKQFRILLPAEHMNDNDKIIDSSEACAEQSVRVVNTHFLSSEGRELPEDVTTMLRQSVKDVLRIDNKVRSLLMMRITQYMEESVLSESKVKVALNPGLSSIQPEVESSTSEFCRIVMHNRNAFDDIYYDVIEGSGPKPVFNTNDKDPEYLEYLYQLKMTPRSNISMMKENLPGPSQRIEKEKPIAAQGNSIVENGSPMSDLANSRYIIASPENNVAEQSDMKNGAPSANDSLEQNMHSPIVGPSDVSIQNGLKSTDSSTSSLTNASSQKSLKHPHTQSEEMEPNNNLPPSAVTTEKKCKTSISPLSGAAANMSKNSTANLNGANVEDSSDSFVPSNHISSIESVNSSALPNDILMGLHSTSQGHNGLDATDAINVVWSPTTLTVVPSEADLYIHPPRQTGKYPGTDPVNISFAPSDSESSPEQGSSEDMSPPVLLREDD